MARRMEWSVIEDFFKVHKAKLLSDPGDYKNNMSKLWFPCKKCGAPHYNTWQGLRRGSNPNFLCTNCMSNAKPELAMLASLAEAHGAKLRTKHYVNARQKLEFECACGRPFTNIWNAYQQGVNHEFLCERCLVLKHWNPLTVDITGRNTEIGGQHWYNLLRISFHLKRGWQGLGKQSYQPFSIHHVFNYEENPLLRSSVTNGFPVKTHLHIPKTVFYNILHSKQWHNPESWNTDEFQNLHQDLYQQLILPYQRNIPNFQFHDLTKYLVTETIIPTVDMEQIHQHEKYWHSKGIIYIPVSWETLAWKPTRDEFFSQIRDELRQFIPEIDQYTGVGYKPSK